ncbi:MAG: tRNA pseudouridine(38-40) synthase TruA [Salinisphaeraceae bacterium]|nr:tRNA pseudouridine(38-40) synthase TruA [Salinisphaeraceae bacterium]
MRFAAGVEYCGTHYAGWQRQHHCRTVQGEVEAALSTVADEPVQVTCAGRTDAGVHAIGQVIHFDSDRDRDAKAWSFGANTHLPGDISLRWVQPVADDFSARYSALARSYRYLMLDSRMRSGLFAKRACWSRYPLDAERMHSAAQSLVGEHDFSSFRARECQSNTPMRNLQAISVRRDGAFIILDVQANAFVHHMVRNIAGVLIAIGKGRRDVGWTQELLEIRDREKGGVTAPACGLYFMQAIYPPQWQLPQVEDLKLLHPY